MRNVVNGQNGTIAVNAREIAAVTGVQIAVEIEVAGDAVEDAGVAGAAAVCLNRNSFRRVPAVMRLRSQLHLNPRSNLHPK